MAFFYVFLFGLGFFLILKGGSLLIESSVNFAKKTKIPPMIVGATLVSIATTFPETTISIIASSTGAEQLAVNTAIGAMVCNFALVLGVSFLLSPQRVETANFVSKWIFFLFSLVLLFAFGIDGAFGVVDSVVLLVVFIGYIIFNLIETKKGTGLEKSFDDAKSPSWAVVIFQFVISACAVGLGANVLVQNVEEISVILGVDEGIVGVSVIAVGTNIPELVTTITSARQNNPEIGIGNIFGASIINCTLLMSGSALFSPSKNLMVSVLFLVVSIICLVAVTAVISLPILSKNQTSRTQGLLLLIIYFIYSFMMVKYL